MRHICAAMVEAGCKVPRFCGNVGGKNPESRLTPMAIYQLQSMLDRYADDYLVLEINHLFVSSTLREEIWLLQKTEDADLLQQVIRRGRAYGLAEISADRNLETYSGGQKAIVACLLVMTAVACRNIRNLRILLINVLESISGETRRQLIEDFQQLTTSHRIRVFTGGGEQTGQIEELA